jgi:hypothetical protein
VLPLLYLRTRNEGIGSPINVSQWLGRGEREGAGVRDRREGGGRGCDGERESEASTRTRARARTHRDRERQTNRQTHAGTQIRTEGEVLFTLSFYLLTSFSFPRPTP